jgi:hypothetical protein
MSHVIEFNAQEQIIRVTVEGELTDGGASELYWSVQNFLSKHEVRGGILDLSPVTSVSVTMDAVRGLSKNPPLFQASQVRVIVAQSDLIFGMARLFQISRSEIHSELFVVRALEEAYKIHGLVEPKFEMAEEPPMNGRAAG